SATWHQAGANLPLRQDGFFATRETHVARQRKLASHACRAATDRGNGYNGSPAETGQHVGKRLEACRSRRQTCRFPERREAIIVRQEEALDGAVEHNNLQLLIGLEPSDDLIQLRNGLWAEDVERRMIECHSPVCWQMPFETDLLGRGHGGIPLVGWKSGAHPRARAPLV